MSNKNKDKILMRRAYGVYIAFVLIMLLVIYKTVSLQVEGRTNVFADVDEKIPVRIVKRSPRVGEILDMNMTPLVTSVTYYDVHMDPTVVSQSIFDAEVSDLAQGLHRLYPDKSAFEYESEIRRARASGTRYLTIRRKVTNSERKQLRTLPIFNLGRMQGGIIDTDESIERQKPNGDLLSRTLGYYKYDERKKEAIRVGIEGAYYDYLKGEDGEEIEQKFSTGWKKIGQIVKDAVEGADIVTTIDKEIQEVAQSELEKKLKELQADHGTVILMEVKTGYIRAIANIGRVSDNYYTELFNYAIGENEVPGSTMKLASIMAGLEDGKYKITDKVNAYGTYNFPGGKKLKDSNHGMGYGRITIKQAFEKSSNVIAQLTYRSYKDEPELFIKRLEQFGLTDSLGMALEGEASPDVPRPGVGQWSALSIPWMSIGYEYRCTPMQMLAFYNAVANNGKLVRPQFVKEIHRSGQVIKRFEPVVLKEKICTDATLRDVQACLEGVMSDGTGKALTSTQFKIAGKTGTAKLATGGKYLDEKLSQYSASFVGYFPAKRPIYTCIVMVSRPKNEYYGARVSGTVFAAIANKVYASELKYHKPINKPGAKRTNDFPRVNNGNSRDIMAVLKQFGVSAQFNYDGEWLASDVVNGRIHLNKKSITKTTVPNVNGLLAKDAVFILESVGLEVKLKGYGRVIRQSLAPGSLFGKGQLIALELGE